MEEFSPTDAAETRDVVAESVAAKNRLDLRGAGSKTDQGASVEADAILNLGGLTGIVDYEPAELVLTARPGTPLSEIEAMLDAQGIDGLTGHRKHPGHVARPRAQEMATALNRYRGLSLIPE